MDNSRNPYNIHFMPNPTQVCKGGAFHAPGPGHYRVTGNNFLQRVYPVAWEQLSAIVRERFPDLQDVGGWEWQFCLKCGEAILIYTDPDIALESGKKYRVDPRGQKREIAPKAPGSYNMRGAKRDTTRIYQLEQEYVSTTTAGNYLGVTRPIVREYIRNGTLEGRKYQPEGANTKVWIVSVRSLEALLEARHGIDARKALQKYLAQFRPPSPNPDPTDYLGEWRGTPLDVTEAQEGGSYG